MVPAVLRYIDDVQHKQHGLEDQRCELTRRTGSIEAVVTVVQRESRTSDFNWGTRCRGGCGAAILTSTAARLQQRRRNKVSISRRSR